MALKGPNAFAALDAAVRVHSPRDCELPQFNSLIQTSADQIAAVGREGNRVHTVLVPIGVFQPLHQISSGGVPHTYTLVQGTGRYVVTIRRHSHSGDSILNAEGVDKLPIENIPETHGLVATARGDVATVAGEVQGVNVLFMAGENVFDSTRRDVPDLDTIGLRGQLYPCLVSDSPSFLSLLHD